MCCCPGDAQVGGGSQGKTCLTCFAGMQTMREDDDMVKEYGDAEGACDGCGKKSTVAEVGYRMMCVCL